MIVLREKDKAPMTDIAVVGHFSIDSIFLPNQQNPMSCLGGAVTYVSLVARRLEATASVISKVGGDFSQEYIEWLKHEGIDLSGVVKNENEQSTRFELHYYDNFSERTLRLKSHASALEPKDVPSSFSAKAIHLAPIAGEVPFELADVLDKRTKILSLDAQGLLRSIDSTGNISLSSSVDQRMLELADVCKCSLDEIYALTGTSNLSSGIKALHDFGVATVIVTMGTKGAVISVENSLYDIPAFASKKVVDSTGAGDAFIGGFLTELIRGRDPFWCACVGAGAASVVVEAVGPMFSGQREEIYRRARVISGV